MAAQINSRTRTALVALAPVAGLVLTVFAPSASAVPAEIKAELGAADAPRSELEKLDTVDLPRGAQLFRYTQEVDGLPVFGTSAVVADAAENAGEYLVTDVTESGIDEQPAAKISRGQAIAIAREATGARDLREQPNADLGINPSGDGGTLVWNVALTSADPLADFVVLVDAATGDVIEKGDILERSIAVRSAAAKLYRPNPAVESPNRFKGLRDNKDKDSKKLTKLRRPVVLPNLYGGPTDDCLEGLNAYATIGVSGEVCSASDDFSGVKRAKSKFEALMSYYHVDRTATYLNGPVVGAEITPGKEIDYDGPAGDPPIGQQDIRANLTKQDNSFYSPTSADLYIGMGSGKVDDAEDGDVIVHEYGHSIHDDQIPGPLAGGGGSFDAANLEGKAMGEAFGDYLSAVMTQRYVEAEGLTTISNTDNVCVMDWDGFGTFKRCLRRADDESTVSEQDSQCPGFPPSYHCMGQVWSSAMWALRSPDEPGLGNPNAALGTTMDVILLGSHYLLDQNSDFADAGFALFQADEIIYPTGTANDGRGLHYQDLVDETVCRELVPGTC